jgi:hypothetical protein
MSHKTQDDERVKHSSHRAGTNVLEPRKESEPTPLGGLHGIQKTNGAAPEVLSRQIRYLQRTAGNGAVQSLIGTREGSPPAIRLQRLAYDKPVRARELQTVFKVPGKSTFILTARDGSKLVAKFEPGSETQEQKKARLLATNLMAKQLLPNVPSFQFLTQDDLTALTQVPANWGADAVSLAGIATAAMPGGQFAGLKLEFLPVGDSLEDMINKAVPGNAPGPGPGRPAPPPPGGAPAAVGPAPARPVLPPRVQTEAMLLLQNNPLIWVDFGRMAAFDLFVGNVDRFHTVTPTVNVQNLDFTGGANPSAVALDNFNPSSSIFAMKNDDRSFGRSFPEPLRKGSAVKTYAQAVVSFIAGQVGIDVQKTYEDSFATGFHMSRDAIKANKGLLKDAVTRSTRAQEQERIDYYSFLLERVKLIK